jgi:hypothetical protein
MSIRDFHSKFVAGERTSLFAALRRLSLLNSPWELAETLDGWPIWDNASGSQTSARLAATLA